jgi:hypothetical protein
MNLEQDRIRLAEAMGSEVKESGALWGGPLSGRFVFRGDGYEMADIRIFDPFTSADDDYAVLEWMRSDERHIRFREALAQVFHEWHGDPVPFYYEIGDYARACLKVLDSE